jgi:hypothetical protein
MALPAEDQRRGLFCLDERLRFMRFLGEHSAPIAFPRSSPGGGCMRPTPSSRTCGWAIAWTLLPERA